MKLLSIAAIFLAATGLYGCANAPPPIVNLAAMDCPSRIAYADAPPLAFDASKEKVTTSIVDDKARCLLEEGGTRALYQVFALPKTAVPYIIAVRSLPWADTILAPKTILLDQDGHPTRTSVHADFTFRGQTLSSLLRSHAGESYLVIASDSEVLGTTVSRIVGDVRQSMVMTPYAAFAIYTGADQTNNLTLTPAGRVETTLTPLPAEKK